MTQPDDLDTEAEGGEAQEPDWKAEARKWETRAKRNGDAAKRLADLEEAQKTEAQKLAESKAAAERERDTARSETARLRAALKHGIPDDLVEMLGSGTTEDIDARAKTLGERLKTGATTTRPVADLKPGALPAGAAAGTAFDADAWIRRQAGR